MKETKIVWMDIGDVRPYEGNPRRNDAAVQAVANSIREFGFRNPILIDGEHVIIAGHTRLKAAESLGMDSVPVVVIDDLPPEKVKALRLADNKTGELAEWDMELLDRELRDLLDADIDMTEFGFEDIDLGVEDIDLLDIVEDEVPPVPEEPRTSPGDMYRLGRHTLLCGDSASADDVSRLMDGSKAQMIFTDPPWNVDYEGGTDEHLKIMNDDLGDRFPEFLSKIFSNMSRHVQGGGGRLCRHGIRGVGYGHERAPGQRVPLVLHDHLE